MMRRLLALLTLLAVPSIASADVAVGNGSIGVPLVATQGGTGQTSFTTNCLIAASSSTALGCTSAPTVSGANLTSGTIPNASLVSNPLPICATWTPTDQSGASLTFTGVQGKYCKLGPSGGPHLVWVTAQFSYPATADTSSAKISLPYAVGADGFNQPISIESSVSGKYVYISNGVAGIADATGTLAQNAALSGANILFMGVYESPT